MKPDKERKGIIKEDIICSSVLPIYEENAIDTREIVSKLKLQISRGYIANIMRELREENRVNYKKKSQHHSAYLYWKKEELLGESYGKGDITYIGCVSEEITILFIQTTFNAILISLFSDPGYKLLLWDLTAGYSFRIIEFNSIQELEETYYIHYQRADDYPWINIDHLRKLIQEKEEDPYAFTRKYQLKDKNEVEKGMNEVNSIIERANELHKINEELRKTLTTLKSSINQKEQEIAQFKVKMQEFNDKRDVEIKALKEEINDLKVYKTENTIKEDIKESRKLLERTFKE